MLADPTARNLVVTAVTNTDAASPPPLGPHPIKPHPTPPHPPFTRPLQVDVYSFGIVMWELWTGREPFEGLNYHALLHQMTSTEGLRPQMPGGAGCCAGGICSLLLAEVPWIAGLLALHRVTAVPAC